MNKAADGVSMTKSSSLRLLRIDIFKTSSGFCVVFCVVLLDVGLELGFVAEDFVPDFKGGPDVVTGGLFGN